ncbi:hypothetical protein CSIRO_3705 [Bradyrhizobiaceae bacterium SG-6C]|nr:hypothetical protein CSIRO_3705 [Bradyrhizobiaceae bacterium SG-6C]
MIGLLTDSGPVPESLSKPHLSLCLRVLSRRRMPRRHRPHLFPDFSPSHGPFA